MRKKRDVPNCLLPLINKYLNIYLMISLIIFKTALILILLLIGEHLAKEKRNSFLNILLV